MGQIDRGGEAEGGSALGVPLGVGAAGSHSVHSIPGQVGAAGSHSVHSIPSQVGAAGSHSVHSIPSQVGAVGSHSVPSIPGQVGAAGSHSVHSIPSQVGAVGSHSVPSIPNQVGAAGSRPVHSIPSQVGAVGSHSVHSIPGQVGAAGSRTVHIPSQVGAAGLRARSRGPVEEVINPSRRWSGADRESVRSSSSDLTGTALAAPLPEPLRFSPQPAASSKEMPRLLGFRPEGVDCLPEPETSLYSLPLAAFSCKVLREGGEGNDSGEVDIVLEDLPLCARHDAARVVGEHLDTVLMQLHKLCDVQRAAQGADCTMEAQELSRLVDLEEGIVQELLACRGDPEPVRAPDEDASEPERRERICSAQGDVGGGCEASVEGTCGAPLQTKIVSVEDVLKDLYAWWSPMAQEYQALVCEKQVVAPVTAQELKRREEAGKAFQVIPAKLVFTLKAFTARRRVRCVACGNHLSDGMYTASQLYAGGLDVVSLRCSLVLMVERQWSAGVVDIKTAFLNAELDREDHGAKRVIVRTPGLWRRLGICVETFWDVQRALYGLQISPAAWSRCRDRTLPKLRMLTSVGQVRLLQFKSDPNIWSIVPADLQEPVDPSRRLGLLLVYVDDLMVLSTPELISEVIAELGKTWELATPELLEEGNLHYRGVEIRRYTQELLSRYPNLGSADVPALKLPETSGDAAQDREAVRKAQQLAGELLWLSGLTRPEMQYAIGAISRMISVNPLEAVSMGEQAIKYLRRYPDRGLVYRPTSMAWGEEGELSVPMSAGSLTGFCDASFAPHAGRSLQATTIFYNQALVAWTSSRQGHTTMSTAEAELVAITTLFSELRALEPLVAEISGAAVTLHMHSDSQAAIAICSTSTNNWRTRHLRLRANYIKEALESGRYSLHHVCGESMRADIGTKPLPSARFHQLTALLGIGEPNSEKVKRCSVNGSLEDKLRTLLACLVVASLVDPAEGAKQAPLTLNEADWQVLGVLAVVVICCWEVIRFLGLKCFKGCVRWGSQLKFCCGRRPVEWIRMEPEEEPELRLFRYVDDAVAVGTQEHVRARCEQLAEEQTAPEGPGTLPALRRRRATTRPQFQAVDQHFEGWETMLTLSTQPVGQDRYEMPPGRPNTVLRWHLSERTRLFVPQGTRLPVALDRFTGKRRTLLIDTSPGQPRGRVIHSDDWREEFDGRAYVDFPWIGCTELQIRAE